MQSQPTRMTAREHARAAIEAALRGRIQEMTSTERDELAVNTLLHYRLYCGRVLFPEQQRRPEEVH